MGGVDIMRRKKETPVPCRHPGCPELVREGSYCTNHAPLHRQQNGGRQASEAWHGLYYTAAWRELRQIQLIKEPFCRMCAADGRRVYATDVDHIRPHRGDPALFSDAGNLQSLCHSCHSKKTAAERAATER